MNCSEKISDGGRSVSFHPCRKPAVEGETLCSLHLKVRRRRDARSLIWAREQSQGDANRKEVEATLQELGLEGSAYYNHGKPGWSNYERKAVVDIDILRAYMKRVA
jgi:hypothetical protein